MNLVPNLPKKVQFLTTLHFSLDQFLPWRRTYDGGRKGYNKTLLFLWLLVKKTIGWDYRTISDMAGISHSTLIRANHFFLTAQVYHKFFRHLVKQAYKKGLIQGKKVSLDSSFVHTFSKKKEIGSGGWNGHKEAIGFKLHLLIDTQTSFPLALIMGDGVTHDAKLAIPLLKKARPWLKKCGYVLADRGYDDVKIVEYIAKSLHAKASIPIRKMRANKQGKKSGNYFNWKSKSDGRTAKHSIYKLRSGIERCFSTLKRTYHLGHEETRGIFSFMKNVYLTLISYMLKKFWTEGSLCL
jgi:hypothetical protein